MDILKIEKLVKAFDENPGRLTYSFSQLQKTYDLTTEEVREAKKIYKESLLSNMSNDVSKENLVLERVWINNKGKTSLQLRSNSSEFSRSDFLSELIKNTSIPPTLDNKIKIKSKDDKHTLLIYSSDKHIGAEVTSDSLFSNEYSDTIFAKRMDRLLLETVRLDSLYHFENIIFLDLGDAADGMDGYTGSKSHKLPQNLTNREVFTTYLQTHIDFFAKLTKHTSANLFYKTVGDSNHGGDMDWMMFVSTGLALNKSFPKVKVDIGSKFIEHFSINDHTFILCHGKDSKNLKKGLPKILDKKTELYIKSYIDSKNIRSKFVHFIKGDLHQAATEYSNFFRYKNVLSMFGASDWVQTNFMSNTKGVSFDILNTKTDTITEHTLFL
jgi:hypothetical protein